MKLHLSSSSPADDQDLTCSNIRSTNRVSPGKVIEMGQLFPQKLSDVSYQMSPFFNRHHSSILSFDSEFTRRRLYTPKSSGSSKNSTKHFTCTHSNFSMRAIYDVINCYLGDDSRIVCVCIVFLYIGALLLIAIDCCL